MIPLDLGDGHFLEFISFAPDRKLNPQYAGLPDCDRIGAMVTHRKSDGSECQGSIMFNCPQSRAVFPNYPLWTVETFEPLTLVPSLQCKCGDHGNIVKGRWVKV